MYTSLALTPWYHFVEEHPSVCLILWRTVYVLCFPFVWFIECLLVSFCIPAVVHHSIARIADFRHCHWQCHWHYHWLNRSAFSELSENSLGHMTSTNFSKQKKTGVFLRNGYGYLMTNYKVPQCHSMALFVCIISIPDGWKKFMFWTGRSNGLGFSNGLWRRVRMSNGKHHCIAFVALEVSIDCATR